MLNLLLTAMGPAFLSFLALGLSSWLGDSTQVWRLSSGFLACFIIVAVGIIAVGRARLPEGQRHLVNNRVFPFAMCFLVTVTLVQVLSASAIAKPAFELFYCGLVAILLVSVYTFVQSVFGGMRLDAGKHD